MRHMLVCTVIALVFSIVSAGGVTHGVTIDLVPVGNPGNAGE